MQIDKEDAMIEYAKSYKAKKIVILFDRGAPDGRIYSTPEEWDEVLGKNRIYFPKADGSL